MSPAMRLLRHVLFLPVPAAERREFEAREIAATLEHEAGRHRAARDHLVRKSDELRDVFDHLIGKLDD